VGVNEGRERGGEGGNVLFTCVALIGFNKIFINTGEMAKSIASRPAAGT